MVNNKVELEGNSYIFQCPHCGEYVVVDKAEVNCSIFRHGVFKSSYLPINPHMSKLECDTLLESGKIYGCSKPFRMVDRLFVEVCDYI